ncbi:MULTISPECIES: hypothetical protein [unclassified Streptomyces]|uniref:hypothetical protein n=1 Tax=unclassified Streptomyces TaxID=2593676 RepID=UPI002366A4FF|nr:MULTISPECIES: hypothetical protein [unclassified Streptomyces]MDF3145610.1 hypothetical protein [Streptomyces sp. T21Q-yed]WDF40852.1 hypothetical protein PBV52_30785 [Streptomyces sp. T12]
MPDMSASASLAMTHLATLAKEVDEDKVTPGVLGFIVFAVMALAVWGLMKSMNRHMGRVDFKEAPDPKAGAGDAQEAQDATAAGPAKPQQG